MKITLDYKDVIRLGGYIVAFFGLLTPQIIGQLLLPWGIADSTVSRISSLVGSIALFSTLVYSVFVKQAVPDGYHTVISSNATPTEQSLTTKTELAVASKETTP